MSDPYALRYRPKRFADLVGQPVARVTMESMARSGTIATSLLLTGPSGVGKTTTARLLAAALLCAAPERPCGECEACQAVTDGLHPALMEIDAASHGLVADIRSLREMVQFSVDGNARIIILDEAQAMSREAFNALLKILEEPPPGTHFFLLTTEPSKIPDTIKSRCMEINFPRVTASHLINYLFFIAEKENVNVDAAVVEHIAYRANGNVRSAVVALDQVVRADAVKEPEYRDLFGEPDFAPSIVAAAALGKIDTVIDKVDHAVRHSELHEVQAQIISVLRDVIKLQSGGQLKCQKQMLDARESLASQISPSQILSSLKMMWEACAKVKSIADDRTLLDLSAVMLVDILSAGQIVQAEIDLPKKLTLQEMMGS